MNFYFVGRKQAEKPSQLQTQAFLLEKKKIFFKDDLDCKEIQQVHPKGDQSWVFTGRTDVEAETPILWPPHAKS